VKIIITTTLLLALPHLLSAKEKSKEVKKTNWCHYSVGYDDYGGELVSPEPTVCSCNNEWTPRIVMERYPDHKVVSIKEDASNNPTMVILNFRTMRNTGTAWGWVKITEYFFKDRASCKAEANSERSKFKSIKQKEDDKLKKFE